MRWRGVAWALLRRAGELNYERLLFHTHPGEVNLAELTHFYQSLMLAWQKTDNNQRPVLTGGMGVAGATVSQPALEDRAVSVQEFTDRLRDCGNYEAGRPCLGGRVEISGGHSGSNRCQVSPAVPEPSGGFGRPYPDRTYICYKTQHSWIRDGWMIMFFSAHYCGGSKWTISRRQGNLSCFSGWPGVGPWSK